MADYPQVLFKNRKPNRVETLEEYRESGGYQALEKFIGGRISPSEVIRLVDESGLRGRGGAGFPTAKKWSSVSISAPFPRYLVANGDEMEPGTFKDRVLLHVAPHSVIEGMILSGYAFSASKAFFLSVLLTRAVLSCSSVNWKLQGRRDFWETISSVRIFPLT